VCGEWQNTVKNGKKGGGLAAHERASVSRNANNLDVQQL